MNKYTIGFIGYGKMAKAISKYICGRTGQIYASDPYVNNNEDGAIMVANNAALINASDIIFLSIKPQSAKEALLGLDFNNKIVISIMAGLKIKNIAAICNCPKIVRVMPNLCAQVGKSVNAFTCIGLNGNELAEIKELLESFGNAYNIGEELFDAVTGLTGSGPAYVFRFIKDLIESGCNHGFNFAQSKDMVLKMMDGCGDLLRSAGSLAEIQSSIDNVCSKGGTTIEGIHALDAGNFDDTVKSAIDNAVRRSKELGS